MWMLDTVALSELRKKRPNPGFMTWFDSQPLSASYTSVLCLGEVRRGVVQLRADDARRKYSTWLEVDLPAFLDDRILPVDGGVADAWSRLGVRGKQEPVDALIGATAAVHGLTVVTRNVRHFDGLGAPVLNPWT